MFRFFTCLFLFTSAAVALPVNHSAQKSDKERNKEQIVRKTASLHRSSSSISAKENGPGATYIFISDNHSQNFLLPANQTTCDDAYDAFLKSVNFESLEKLAKDGHIIYDFYQSKVYFDGPANNDDPCDTNVKGQLITKIVGIIQAIDDIGKTELAKYVEAVQSNFFFAYPVRWIKPQQIVSRYVMSPMSPLRAPTDDHDFPQGLSYYKAVTTKPLNDTEMLDFAAAFKSADKLEALSRFFKARVENPSTVDGILATAAADKKVVAIDFQEYPVYVMDDFTALAVPDLGEDIEYQCQPGACLK